MNMDFTVISGLMPFALEKQTLADPLTQMTNKMKLNLLTNQPEWSSKTQLLACLCEDVTVTAAAAGGDLLLWHWQTNPHRKNTMKMRIIIHKNKQWGFVSGDMHPRHDSQSNLWHSGLQPILSQWVPHNIPHNKPYEIRAHYNGEPYLEDI